MLKLWDQAGESVAVYSRCIYSCACGQHLCTWGCVWGWQRKFMEINASSCSLYTSNVALLLVPQRSNRPHARGSKANETAIAQTHPADPWILIRLRRERDGCRASSVAQQQPDELKRGRGAQLYIGGSLGFKASPQYVVKCFTGWWQISSLQGVWNIVFDIWVVLSTAADTITSHLLWLFVSLTF